MSQKVNGDAEKHENILCNNRNDIDAESKAYE